MSVKYTKEQWKAVSESGCNILVSAAAGSGKTAVLTERIIQKIINPENPENIDSLLIVTFTDAATSEMRQRISAKLDEAFSLYETENPELAEHISRQITLLNKAYISTIDSFCLNVVRKNFNILDIDPNFRIIDNSEDDIIKEEILEELFEELYEKNEESFINFINFFSNNYSKNTDSNAKSFILNVYTFMQSMPDPLKWLDESVNKFNIKNKEDFYKNDWVKFIVTEVLLYISNMKTYAEKILDLLYSEPDTGEKFILTFEEFMKYLTECETIIQNNLNNCHSLLENPFKIADLKTSKKNPLSDNIKQTVSELKTALSKKLKSFYGYLNYFSDNSFKITKNTYPIMLKLQYILKEFSQRFFNVKKEKFIFSFNDISHLALNVLSDKNGNPSNSAIEFQNKFHEIIMDEYQDSSELQESILSLISKNENGVSNRFMVGDIKQCIYGFRLANPYLFAEKYSSYTTDFSKSKEYDGYKIDLSKNFRSREHILSAINFIFKQIMTKEFSNIEYDKNAMLYYGADFPVPPENTNISDIIELELIKADKINNEDNDETEEIPDDDLNDLVNAELELLVIANKIDYMINTEKLHIYDNNLKQYRPLRYKDIVILAYSVKDISSVVQDIFSQKKIPFTAKTKGTYFDSIEISIILAFLSIIDNPYQDTELFTVLHSPIYSFTFDELAKIKIVLPEKSFYSALIHYTTAENKNRDPKTIHKINIFLSDFNRWREISLNSTINELLQTIYDDTDYYNYVGLLPNGNLRRANLKIFQEKAIQFEKTNSKGLFKFMRYIEKVKKSNFTENETIFYDDEDAVTITNIHQSKGLEYPVLFLCSLNKKFNFDPNRPPVDQFLGIGLKYKDIKNHTKFNTVSQHSIYLKHKNEIIAEEIRLLYVALTRAKEKLILVGSINKFENTLQKILSDANTSEKQFSYTYIESLDSFMKIIISSLARHKDADIIRNFSNEKFKLNNELYNDCSKWKINITDRSQLSIYEKYSEEKKLKLYKQLQTLDINIDYSGKKEEIKRRLLWTYPNCEIKNIPITTSISEIKRRFYEEEEYIPKILPSPAFIKEYTGLSPAQKGTAVHTLLEHIDFNKTYDTVSLKNYVQLLVKNNILSKQEADSININKIILFLSSEIVKRIKASNSVHKETPFVIGLTPSEVFGAEYININSDNNKILVHGIIDLYFEENGSFVLLDYKTDYIENNNVSKISDKYKIQIELYKKSIELSSGKKVSEAGLYLFNADSYIKY